jgi:[calcium/calmodulin-dependent protein kinase] kinase
MSIDDEDSLGAYLKNKNKDQNMNLVNEDEIEKDKKEEEEIFRRYEKIGNLTDIQSIQESNLIKNYDKEGNKYYNEYKYVKLLGRGSYSKVKLVIKDDVKYAMKIIDKKVLKSKKIFKQDKDGNVIITNLLKDALKEIAILKKLDHPNIIKLYEILHNHQKQKIYLILEYAEYGDIVEYDEDKGIFSINKHLEKFYKKINEGTNKKINDEDKIYYNEDDIRHFCKHILLGLDYLHKNGIIHHDIKPNNILLCKQKICKITDFNFSSILENLNEDNIGTNGESADNFRAPETIHLDDEINGKDYPTYQGKPLDIWALGITLYIITYLKFPFDTDKGVLELYKIIKQEKIRFPLEPWYSRKIKFLIKSCLEKDPRNRKSVDEIIKILMVHRRENLDKFKPVFLKRKYTIDIPNNELVLTLDFISNSCSAVFEDKSVIKLEKKYSKPIIPEGRSQVKPIIKDNKISKKNSNNIIIEKTEIKRGNSIKMDFITIVKEKIEEIRMDDDNEKNNTDNKNDAKIISKDVVIVKEGKNALKEYISKK